MILRLQTLGVRASQFTCPLDDHTHEAYCGPEGGRRICFLSKGCTAAVQHRHPATAAVTRVTVATGLDHTPLPYALPYGVGYVRGRTCAGVALGLADLTSQEGSSTAHPSCLSYG